MRWDPYLLIFGKELQELLNEHFCKGNRKVLFVLGKGFDLRMNLGIEWLVKSCPNIEVEVHLINFNEGKHSPSGKYGDLVTENIKELETLLGERKIVNKSINIWKGSGRKKRKIADREASNLYNSFEDLAQYTDIIVDISALPRGIYFSLVGKLLAIIDHSNEQINLFILTAENAAIDSEIAEQGIREDLHFQFGFGGGVEQESLSIPIIWLPILGEKKDLHFDKANQHISPDEICPILPFPSKNPRRSDDIFGEYHELLFDVLRIEAQNIMYVPEQNPFEVYRKLSETIANYHSSLSILNGCKTVISTFSSKLLSIGALLAAFEAKADDSKHVGILNVDCQGYEIKNIDKMKSLKEKSEIFVTWLTGVPYQE